MRRDLYLSLIVLAAGCSQKGLPATNGDGGTTADLTVSTQPDLSVPTPVPDMAMPPIVGTLLTGGTFFLDGLTSDDQFAIATDTAHMGALVAVPLAGGNPVTIDKVPNAYIIRGSVVFTWDQVDQMSGVGPGNSWTGAQLNAIGNTSIAGVADASADGKWIFYTDNADSTGGSADLVVSHADGTSPMTFVKGAVFTMQCSPNGQFGANGKLVVSYCDAPTDGGSQGANLVVVDPATGQPTSLATGMANWFAIDSTGTKVLSADASGKGSLFSTTGAAAISVDTDVQDGFFLPDGSAVVYRTSMAVLKRADASATPSPISLAMNANQIQTWFVSTAYGQNLPAVSPDGKWVLFSNVFDAQNGLGDLNLVSTGTPGTTPTVLVSNVSGALFGDPFTTDSSLAVYYSTVTMAGAGLIGDLQTEPVAGGMPTQHATRVWGSFAGPGTLVVYNDNYKAGRGSGRADLRIVDVSKMDPANLIAAQAEADFFLTKARDKVVFSMTLPAATDGLYIAPVK
jgi:hypothetical protein